MPGQSIEALGRAVNWWATEDFLLMRFSRIETLQGKSRHVGCSIDPRSFGIRRVINND
jgi:hypothetical protein